MIDLFMNALIRNKVIATFGIMLLLVAILGAFSVHTLAAMDESEINLKTSMDSLLPLEALGRDAEALAQEGTVEQDFAATWGVYGASMDPGRETVDGQAINAIAQDAAPRPAPKAVKKFRIPPDAPMQRKPAPAGADQWDDF